jgi:uncharacterized protein with NAD-binding domain and iron-sulfur cluster
MTKQRIAIVGGGMAALATAFQLTQSEDLRERFDITIYQMGWRLGGKGATGRDDNGRVVEHGLHVWFGCYENAFRVLLTAYEEWRPFQNPRQAIKSCDDALKAQCDSAIGAGDSSNIICLNWPRMPGRPGKRGEPDAGDTDLSPLACFSQMLNVMQSFYRQLTGVGFDGIPPPDLPLDIGTIALLLQVNIDANDYTDPKDLMVETKALPIPPVNCLLLGADWSRQLAINPSAANETQLRAFAGFLRDFAKNVRADSNFVGTSVGSFLAQLIDVGTAAIKGVIVDIILGGTTIDDLDLMDFREWLAVCGAARDSIYGSPIVQALYDSMLEYCDGDRRRPSYGAGTAAQAVFRIYGTYKDAFAFEMQSGMGEVVVMPIYKVLQKRGVKFRFFMKLKRIGLDLTRTAVTQIEFDRQVNLRNGIYDPTIPPEPRNGYLECWPDQPLWDQICCGEELAAKCLDLESYWCSHNVGQETPQFDTVVLAIPLGAFKKLNTAPGPCDELIEANQQFRMMMETATLVPSISFQVWCSKDTAGLGWPPDDARPRGAAAKTVISTGPDPLDIWADMSQVLAHEPWQPGTGPMSLQYLCGVLETDLFRAPPGKEWVPAEAKERARTEAIKWLSGKARYIWPKSSSGGSFDWNDLFDPNGARGSNRIDGQVCRANVDPSSCCVASVAGSTRWRLATDASGFDRLYIAGTWIDTGFNTECIEAAVMSGMQAARAISGASFAIPGEDFLRFGYDPLSLVTLGIETGLSLLSAVCNATRSSSSAEVHRRSLTHRSPSRLDGR